MKTVEDNPFEIDQKVQNSFKEKTWDETITKDSWMVFKIMAEFVDGYEKLAKIGPCVSIFGSARLSPGSEYYELAAEIAEKITEMLTSETLLADRTLIFTSHSRETVRAVATRLIFLDRGTVAADTTDLTCLDGNSLQSMFGQWQNAQSERISPV